MLSAEFYLQQLKDFREFIQTIHSQRDVLVNAQKKAELEVEDIEHAAEFYNLDASHGYQRYKMLHDARVRRRKCKNAIAWIDFILEQCPERFVENDPSARIVERAPAAMRLARFLCCSNGKMKGRPLRQTFDHNCAFHTIKLAVQ